MTRQLNRSYNNMVSDGRSGSSDAAICQIKVETGVVEVMQTDCLMWISGLLVEKHGHQAH